MNPEAAEAAAVIDAERVDGATRAVQHLVTGNDRLALFTITRSVQRQARIAGLGDILTACPCGGRCR